MMHPCTKDMSSGWKNMQKRFLIFENNVEFIESFNAAGNKPYKLSINHLADQTNEEFVASHNGYKYKGSHSQTPFKYGNVTDIPTAVDWRQNGAVTAVKDQGQCGNQVTENFYLFFYQ